MEPYYLRILFLLFTLNHFLIILLILSFHYETRRKMVKVSRAHVLILGNETKSFILEKEKKMGIAFFYLPHI